MTSLRSNSQRTGDSFISSIASSHSIVNSFLDYVNRQNDDFRPKALHLSNDLEHLIDERTNEWKFLIAAINE
jgi:hypothetical protein